MKYRPFAYTVETPANDERCSGCRALHCSCPDPVWRGIVPAKRPA